MKRLFLFALGCAVLASAMKAQDRPDLLWVAGEAVYTKWNLDEATAIEAETSNDKVFTGTVYLEADKDFKFLTTYTFGNMEYRAAEANATPDADGVVKLVYTNEGDDNKIRVSESANYLITVNTGTLEAKIVKSAYQETQIKYASLFMVGSALESGYEVDKGLAMVQNPVQPYVFTAKADMKAGDFKIATCLKGAGSFDPKYWLLSDPDNEGKIIPNNTEDTKWTVSKAGTYDVTVNLLENTINITKEGEPSLCVPVAGVIAGVPEYYGLDGVAVAAPAKGQIVIRIMNGTADKIRF